MTNENSTALSELRPGEKARVVELVGGRGFKNRMLGMGLHAGFELEMIQNAGAHGPIVISVGGSRLGIGAGMADKIRVRREA